MKRWLMVVVPVLAFLLCVTVYAWLNRYQITAVSTQGAIPAGIKLDRWTGRVMVIYPIPTRQAVEVPVIKQEEGWRYKEG